VLPYLTCSQVEHPSRCVQEKRITIKLIDCRCKKPIGLRQALNARDRFCTCDRFGDAHFFFAALRGDVPTSSPDKILSSQRVILAPNRSVPHKPTAELGYVAEVTLGFGK